MNTSLEGNGTLFEIYDFFHPGLLNMYLDQCRSNPQLMKLEPNRLKGIIYAIIGFTCEFLYLLCMIAMCRSKFLKIICYRILFVIGCFDMVAMVTNSLLPGYFLITGKSFCHTPLLNLYIGSLAFPTWTAYTGLSISLVINRCVDFTWPERQAALFGGKIIILWTGIPTLYGIFLYFKLSPMLYHAPTATYYFGADPAKAQIPIMYPIINGFVPALLLVLNILMLRAMFRRNHATITKLQRVIMIQCLGISMSILTGDWLYVTMQFVEMPLFMITVANICWQFNNGSLAIFYLLVNKSMRGEVLKLLRISCFKKNTVYTSSTEQKIAPNSIPS